MSHFSLRIGIDTQKWEQQRQENRLKYFEHNIDKRLQGNTFTYVHCTGFFVVVFFCKILGYDNNHNRSMAIHI